MPDRDSDERDFDERLQGAKDEIETEIDQAEAELKRLRERRGRLKGQDAPEAQVDGVERRISTLEARLDGLHDEDPIGRVDEPDPTPKSFHSI